MTPGLEEKRKTVCCVSVYALAGGGVRQISQKYLRTHPPALAGANVNISILHGETSICRLLSALSTYSAAVLSLETCFFFFGLPPFFFFAPASWAKEVCAREEKVKTATIYCFNLHM